MKANSRNKMQEVGSYAENKELNKKTVKAYIEQFAKNAKRRELSAKQEEQIKASWSKKIAKRTTNVDANKEGSKLQDQIIEQVKQAAQEFHEMKAHVGACDATDIIHAAKIQRLGNQHIENAKSMTDKTKHEVRKVKHDANPHGNQRITNISRAIIEAKAQPLACVQRDQPTKDGGKVGGIATYPRDIDAIVKRAWQRIHSGG